MDGNLRHCAMHNPAPGPGRIILDATPANLVTHNNITASGHLVLGNSTEIYSGSINGPNVIILHTTGGLTNFFAGAYAKN